MAEAGKVTIRFEAKGDEVLIRTIEKLDAATKALINTQQKAVGNAKKDTSENANRRKEIEKLRIRVKALGGEWSKNTQIQALVKKANQGNRIAMEQLRIATGNYRRELMQTGKASMLGVRNNRILGGSFAVLRSRILIATFALMLLSRTLGKTIAASNKQEEAEKKLSAVLKSTGNVTGITSMRFKAMASDLQAVTKFGDETIISAQALMLTFTKIGRDIFPEAIEATLNISEAMGQDLQQTVIQVGKSLNDPIKGMAALSRVGIQLSKTQQSQIKNFVRMNDVAGAQKVILQELEIQFGGMAKEATQTLTGALIHLKNAWGDLLERIGNEIAPLLGTIAESFKDITRTMMSEQEKEIAILQGLGFTEELINERRKVMHRETMTNLQAQGIGLLATWRTIAEGEDSLKALQGSYKALSGDIKENQGLMEADERIIGRLADKWKLTRSEMEYLITTTMARNKGLTTWLVQMATHPIKAFTALEELMKAVNDEEFKAIVKRRESSETFKEQKKQLESFMASLRAYMELMGHKFPEILVESNFSIEEHIKAWGRVNQAYGNAISSVEAFMNSEANRHKQNEINAANEIRNENLRKKKLDDIETKYAGKAKQRAKDMKGWKYASAISNVALGLTQTWRDPHMPYWAKVIAVVSQAVAGAAQIATINASSFAKGGEFITNRPEIIQVGEAGREHVKITPVDRPESMALGSMGGVNINFSGNVLSQDFIEDEAIPMIKEAIRRGADIGVA